MAVCCGWDLFVTFASALISFKRKQEDMILIADGGSTKTDWAVVEGGRFVSRFVSRGMNPYNVSADTMRRELEEVIVPNVKGAEVIGIFIYASGCSARPKQVEVEEWFRPFFPDADIEVEGDLLGAARAACGSTAAIAAILGTGSNSCLYDGSRIVENVPSLGYVLCDEGAGTNIGRLLLREYLRGRMPKELHEEFARRYPGDETDFLNRLYKEEAPNYYLASFACFAMENKSHQYIAAIIEDAFDSFFIHQVCHYTDYAKYDINIVGSIGYLAREEFERVAGRYGMRVGKVVKAPLDALVEYHLSLL